MRRSILVAALAAAWLVTLAQPAVAPTVITPRINLAVTGATFTIMPGGSLVDYGHQLDGDSIACDGPALAAEANATNVQSVADKILGVSEVQSGLAEGDALVMLIGNASWSGVVHGGHAAMARGGGAGALALSLSQDLYLELLNSLDMPNTAKLIITQHLFGVDGNAKVKSAFHVLYTGAFDARLQASAPASGQQVTFTDGSGKAWTGTLSTNSTGALVVRLGSFDYHVNGLGALDARLPPAGLGSGGAGSASNGVPCGSVPPLKQSTVSTSLLQGAFLTGPIVVRTPRITIALS